MQQIQVGLCSLARGRKDWGKGVAAEGVSQGCLILPVGLEQPQ